GNISGAFNPSSTKGAGRLHLEESGTSRFGKTWVSSNLQYVDVPLDIKPQADIHEIRAAIWWPEAPAFNGNLPIDTHNDVDLQILAPGWFGGVVQATSNGADGVFERAVVRTVSKMKPGWKLRIRPHAMRTGAQTVYWAAHLLH